MNMNIKQLFKRLFKMGHPSGICKIEGCNKPQLPGANGYCGHCFGKYTELRKIEQNDVIIDLLTTLNTNIKSLENKIENVSVQQNSTNVAVQETKQVIEKIEEVFIPSIDTSGEIKTPKNKMRSTKRNISDIANYLSKVDE